jgi:hypothetical protein
VENCRNLAAKTALILTFIAVFPFKGASAKEMKETKQAEDEVDGGSWRLEVGKLEKLEKLGSEEGGRRMEVGRLEIGDG